MDGGDVGGIGSEYCMLCQIIMLCSYGLAIPKTFRVYHCSTTKFPLPSSFYKRKEQQKRVVNSNEQPLHRISLILSFGIVTQPGKVATESVGFTYFRSSCFESSVVRHLWIIIWKIKLCPKTLDGHVLWHFSSCNTSKCRGWSYRLFYPLDRPIWSPLVPSESDQTCHYLLPLWKAPDSLKNDSVHY